MPSPLVLPIALGSIVNLSYLINSLKLFALSSIGVYITLGALAVIAPGFGAFLRYAFPVFVRGIQ